MKNTQPPHLKIAAAKAAEERRKAKPKQYRKAVEEKCRECIYDELAAGSFRMQVRGCPVYECPLWKVRPCGKPSELNRSRFSGAYLAETGMSEEEANHILANPYVPFPDRESVN